MKKIFSLIILILLLNSSILNTFASLQYSKQIRWKIMDNFKKEQYNNIYNKWNDLLKEDVNFFETQNKIMMFETIRSKNNEKIEELDTKKSTLTSRVNNLEETLALLDEDIENNQKEILSISRAIVELQMDINKTKNDIEEKNQEIYENKKVLLDYISHIYKKQNTLYATDDKDIDSLKTALLSDWTLWDILSELHFSTLLEVTWQSLVEQYRKLIKEMFVKKLELQKKQQEQKNNKKQEEIKKKSLKEKKIFKQKILDYTKWQEELFTQYLKDKMNVDISLKIKIIQNNRKLKDQKNEILSKYNCKYIDENLLSNSDEIVDFWDEKDNNCAKLSKILTLEGKLKPFSQNKKNVFLWPVEPKRWLSAYYRDKDYTTEVWSTHDAIDIRTPQWTEIIAPADWYVTYLKAPTDEWYAYMVLKHANWFVTVYWHINEALVKEYDMVKAWDVIAKSWGEVWTFWAWPMTTWPHLHFEVFKDKEYVDPLNYLDLTHLKEIFIPKEQKYAYKYIEDYKENTWDEYKGNLLNNLVVFKLTWDTEIERQKDLLSKYATSDFNNWDMWVEESVDAKIDPSFMMCIWLAESWLGRNLKTSYNVWNIWNTDSGGTWDFDNPRNWVYWMGKTLNNQFLWKYTTMDKLSRYWNKDGSIYASSPINWQNNIVRCLSALKDTHIDDKFEFRLK